MSAEGRPAADTALRTLNDPEDATPAIRKTPRCALRTQAQRISPKTGGAVGIYADGAPLSFLPQRPTAMLARRQRQEGRGHRRHRAHKQKRRAITRLLQL